MNQTPPGQSPPITDSRVGDVNRALITLFVPPGARLLTSKPAASDPVDALPNHTEDGLLVFARSLDAWPGSPGEVSFGYEIRGVIQTTPAGHVYQLTIQHQPMVNPAQLTVTVTLPAGTTRSLDLAGLDGARQRRDDDGCADQRLRHPARLLSPHGQAEAGLAGAGAGV